MLLASEQGFAHELAIGTTLRGRALVEQGQVEEGIVQTRQGLDAHRATGAEIARPNSLALLAEAYEKAGQGNDRSLIPDARCPDSASPKALTPRTCKRRKS
jgi:hypothetical protein